MDACAHVRDRLALVATMVAASPEESEQFREADNDDDEDDDDAHDGDDDDAQRLESWGAYNDSSIVVV